MNPIVAQGTDGTRRMKTVHVSEHLHNIDIIRFTNFCSRRTFFLWMINTIFTFFQPVTLDIMD